MRTVHRIAALLLPAFLLMALAPVALAQSPNSPALKWFTRSQQENDPDRKIEALIQAIKYDSLFADAYYQLGQIYARQQNHEAAELYFVRAGALLTASAQGQLKAQTLFDLAIARQQLGKLREAEAVLREAKTLTAGRQVQAAIRLELGALLYRQQRYPEAFAEILGGLEADTLRHSSAPPRANEFHALYLQAQRHGAAGEIEKAVAVYDSLLQRLGVLELAARLTAAPVDSNVIWPLSAAIKPRQPKRSLLFPISAVMTVILLPLLGLTFFSPMARANFHLWRKNYPAAARTLEKLLERHPAKARLYAPLAELYLQLGRTDEGSLRVYQTVLWLNLPTRRRDEINSVLAQKYIAEGRTDSDVIEVLENALKVESRKQNGSLKVLK